MMLKRKCLRQACANRAGATRKEKGRPKSTGQPFQALIDKLLRPLLLLLSHQPALLFLRERIGVLVLASQPVGILPAAKKARHLLIAAATHRRLLPQRAQFYTLLRRQHLQNARFRQRTQANRVCLGVGDLLRTLRDQSFIRSR